MQFGDFTLRQIHNICKENEECLYCPIKFNCEKFFGYNEEPYRWHDEDINEEIKDAEKDLL